MEKKSGSNLKRLILDTTRKLLIKDGYGNLSMRKIAREINYSATSIYLHFESKDALCHALIDEGMCLLLEQQSRIAEMHPDDVFMRLRALCAGYVSFGLQYSEYYEIMFLIHPDFENRFPVSSYRQARRNLELFKRTLDQGVVERKIEPQDTYAATNVVWASLHGVVSILLARRLDYRIDRQQFIDNVLDQIVRSVARTEAYSSVTQAI